jgi:hypothetical protein
MISGFGNWAHYFILDLSIVGVLGAVIVGQLRSWPRWLVITLHLTWLLVLVLRLVAFRERLQH